ncbi:ABC transporter permease [Dankookia rubra]|uniref:ABC transporter permease n=1 Tax=Dankookia rubra TaxID=1442381 RepID=A0A4R5QJP1_9PROT|nr:ABC transporter permease [Dankookia rubra]TDH62921.1 ABC transporter permease [Dankookia rubra]
MRRVPGFLVTALSVALVLGAWVFVTTNGLVRDLFLPGPRDLWLGFSELMEDGYKGRTMAEHLGMSLLRVGAGFLTGALAGTVLGLAMGTSRRLDAAAAPFVEFLRPLPQLAYLVLLIVWLGIGEASKITMLFLAALPVAAIAARDGVRNIPPERLRMAQSLGASRGQVFWHVVAPSALPEILTGARLALGIVYGTLIASEIIAGSNGIGWMILDAGRFLRSDYAFVGILVIGLTGILIDRLLLLLERRVVHWAGR